MKEQHCKGFQESPQHTPLSYSEDQGLSEYNHYNDKLATLIQHESIRSGSFMPSNSQLELYTLALYNIDTFRTQIKGGQLNIVHYPEEILSSDEDLLLFAIEWLKEQFFPNAK